MRKKYFEKQYLRNINKISTITVMNWLTCCTERRSDYIYILLKYKQENYMRPIHTHINKL
jgi:hypothetical protein